MDRIIIFILIVCIALLSLLYMDAVYRNRPDRCDTIDVRGLNVIDYIEWDTLYAMEKEVKDLGYGLEMSYWFHCMTGEQWTASVSPNGDTSRITTSFEAYDLTARGAIDQIKKYLSKQKLGRPGPGPKYGTEAGELIFHINNSK